MRPGRDRSTLWREVRTGGPVTDTPPGPVPEDLRLLEEALDEVLPPRVLDRSLPIGTWNLRHFGG